MKIKKRVLIAPLNWGIGHATRCIPIIKELLFHDFEVVIAADGRPLHLLNTEFSELETVHFSSYNIRYSKYLPMNVSMLLQTPKIMWNIKKENIKLNNIINQYKIDGIISDNRYGLYTNKVPCAFITHQLEIQTPYFKKHIQKINYRYINKFDACWVIDNKKNNLAGNLSKPSNLPKNTIYIGNLSRFSYKKIEKRYDFLGIVSGPEPQRTVLEQKLIKALKDKKEKSIIVLGKPEINNTKKIGNLTIKSHLKSEDLNTIILESNLIICRPGYSTIMDLQKLKSKAFLIPTPGQTEQEYLAKILLQKNICYYQNQNQFNFEKGVCQSEKYTGFTESKEEETNWQELFSLF